MTIPAGTQLGPYEIVGPLGAGGMGEVYKARDTRLDRWVAVKISQTQFSDRFEREARAVAALNHPHICTLHDVGPNYLVMEYIEGAPLQGPLASAKAVEYAGQILDALEVAHSKGIVHRDLKPSNILVTDRGIKLLDFGLARIQRASASEADTALPLTEVNAVLGTPAYMSPEQWQGKPADARSDIYAFGCVFHEMLTGTRLADKRMAVKPASLERVLRGCLQVNPDDRWGSAREVKRQIARALGRRPSTVLAFSAVAAVVLVAGGALAWRRANRVPPLTERDVVVLADFTNATGDTIFDVTLREALAAQLEESPFLKVQSDDQVRETLRLMGRTRNEPFTSQLAREVCQRGGHKATIGGSIAGLGKTYVITLQAADCQTGDSIAREQVEAEDKEHVLRSVATAATKLRARLGESLGSLQAHERRDNVEVTTPSLEAFQAYALGREQDNQTAWMPAIAFYKRATELDPTFAMAYLLLGQKYGNLQELSRREEYFKKAFALIDHVTPRERLLISGLYYNQVTLEADKAAETWQTHSRLYPRESSPHNYLGLERMRLGEFEKAIAEFEEAIRLDPRDAVFRGNLMMALAALNRIDDAKAAAEKAFAEKVDGLVIHRRLLHLAHVAGDRAAAQKEIERFAGTPQEFQSLNLQAEDASAHGRQREARVLTRRAVEAARRQNLLDTPAVLLASAAQAEAAIGRCDVALATVRPLIPRDPQPDNTWRVAQALAFCGDAAPVLKLIDAVTTRFRASTLWNDAWVPGIQASIEVTRGQAAKALELLAPSKQPFSKYLAGLAHLRLGHGREAGEAFQYVIDHKGYYWGGGGPGGVHGMLYAPSLVGRARAVHMSGDLARAKQSYEDFFTFWKDADSDVPLLMQARKEYAESHWPAGH